MERIERLPQDRLRVHLQNFIEQPHVQRGIIALILLNAAILGMETFPYAWAFFIPFILVATFTILNLLIAIIVNAMQSVGEKEHDATLAAVGDARDHIEADLHREVQAMRQEIRELKTLLVQGEPARTGESGSS